eukprot:scaffold266_cov248-Pinguiococcus_pyrenoidosus.AAC.23
MAAFGSLPLLRPPKRGSESCFASPSCISSSSNDEEATTQGYEVVSVAPFCAGSYTMASALLLSCLGHGEILGNKSMLGDPDCRNERPPQIAAA